VNRYHQVPVLIDQSEDADVSEAAEILGYRVVGILVPASWDGGYLSIMVDPNGNGTFYDLCRPDSGNPATFDDPGASNIVMTAGGVRNEPNQPVFIVGHSIKVKCESNVAGDRKLILLCVTL